MNKREIYIIGGVFAVLVIALAIWYFFVYRKESYVAPPPEHIPTTPVMTPQEYSSQKDSARDKDMSGSQEGTGFGTIGFGRQENSFFS